MSWQYTVYVYPILFATVASLVFGGYTLQYIRQHGRDTTLTIFLAVTVGLVVWTGFSAVKLLSTDPATKLLAYRLLYPGVSPLGALALLFAFAYTDRERWLRAPVVLALMFAPALYCLLVFTNPFNLAIESVRLLDVDGLTVMRVDTGPAHLVLQYGYSAVCSALAVALIGSEALRLGRSYLPQALLLGLGIMAPVLYVLTASADLLPVATDGVNLLPMSAAVTVVAIGIALFRFRLFDLPPLAYTTAMAESPDRVLVFDAAGRLVHTNERGETLVASLSGGRNSGVDMSTLGLDPETDSTDVVAVESADGPQYFSVRSQSLERPRGVVGWVVVCRDVTDQQRRKAELETRTAKLELLNRVVRHDIRNDMAVVLGYAEHVEPALDDDQIRTYFERMVDNSEHVVELTHAVGALVKSLTDETATSKPVPLGPILEREINGVRSMDGVVVDAPDSLPTTAVRADEMLGTVFRNVLTNAVRHNDTDNPEIDVSVRELEAVVEVRIADNGPGIPADRRTAVFGRGEKGLDSPGTGIGLYLVDTLVDSYGGTVRVESNEPRGAVFVIELPTAHRDGPATATE